MQAAFDDGGDGSASITCVAGYFFRDEVLAPLRLEWRRLLGRRRFHMVDLVHGHEDFADLSDPKRDELAKGLISTIKQFMTVGVAFSVERASYDKYIQEVRDCRHEIGGPYALCARLCLASAARWMEQEEIPTEETTYFFESGNSKQREANEFLSSIIKNPDMDERYRYVTHSFIRKNKLPSLDAADLRAWEWNQQCKRFSGLEDRAARASLKSLCEKPHLAHHFDRDIRIAFVHALLEPFVVPGAGRLARFIKPAANG